jgi:hypothetical protein
MKLKFYFQECVDADDFVDFGYDYLNLSTNLGTSIAPSPSPFKVISYDHMQNIMDRETVKNPSEQALDVGDRLSIGVGPTSTVYLTPNFLTLGTSRFAVNSPAPEAQQNNMAAATLLAAANLLRSSAINPQGLTPPAAPQDASPLRINIVNSITAIMGSNNCTPTILAAAPTSDGNPCGPSSPLNAFGDIISPSVTLQSEFIDAADILSENSPFVKNTNPTSHPDPSTVAARTHGDQDAEVADAARINLEVLCYLIQTDFLVDRNHQHEFSPVEITSGRVFRDRGMSTATIYQDVLDASNDPKPQNALVAYLAQDSSDSRKPSQQELDYASALDSKPRATDIQAMAFKYGMIRKCQYLAGFKKLNNIVSPSVPIWTDLTVRQYNSLKARNATVLCRLVETDSKFKRYDGVQGPLYNKIFIISPYQDADIPVRGQGSSGTVATVALSPSVTENQGEPHNKYAYSIDPPVGYNEMLRGIRLAISEESELVAKKQERVRYTDGRDYRIVNGAMYAGPYHFHRQENGTVIAMVGPRHSAGDHRALVPVSNRGRTELAKATLEFSTGIVNNPGKHGPHGGGFTGGGGRY